MLFRSDFLATIAPHGVIELTAIHIAGAAGLLIAGAMLFPGRRKRSESLAIEGRRVAILLGGVIAMLVIAALIEAFGSPQRTPAVVRGGVGAITAVAVVLLFAPRHQRPRRTAST